VGTAERPQGNEKDLSWETNTGGDRTETSTDLPLSWPTTKKTLGSPGTPFKTVVATSGEDLEKKIYANKKGGQQMAKRGNIKSRKQGG